MKGLEFESLTCKILYLIARGGNKLITNIPSLADYLDEDRDKIRKELIYMSKNRLISMHRVHMKYVIKEDVDFEGEFLKLEIRPKKDSLIMLAPSFYYQHGVDKV